MKYTKNYRLPQWVKDDRIMMEDFNAMNASIENGLTSTAADSAKAKQDAAQAVQTANAAAVAKPYVVGSYTGTGATQDINLGFRPRFLIVSGMKETGDMNLLAHLIESSVFTAGENAVQNRCQLTDTGFTVFRRNTNQMGYPSLTEADRVYDYIAFR